MSIFDRVKKFNESKKDEADLLRLVAKLTPEDIDKMVSIAKSDYLGKEDNLSKSMTDYYDLVHSVFNSTSFNSVGNTPHTRNQRYEIYEEMDTSTAYISSALDILSDDATQADEDGVIIHVKSDSTKIENLVQDFIVEFELEDKVSKWARAIAKYGDLFIKVDGEYTKGVSYINDTIYPGMIERRDINGRLVAFLSTQNSVYSNDDFFAPWEFVHFRHKGDIYKEESSAARSGILSRDQFDESLTSAYGQSILRPAIKVYAQLRFVENMILLSRLTNSIRRNIFLINVGEVAPDKAFETISNYANLLKKDVNLNIEDNLYSASKHTINYDEDIFIPVSDPQNDVRIEQVGGDANISEQYDLEYLLNKLFSALKVPKAYLNYEQDLNARSTLIQLDIRYARSVSQLQNTIISGLRRLINIHLAYLGLDPEELDLDITLTPVSAIDEESRLEQQQAKINAARDMWDLLGSMMDSVSNPEDGTQMNPGIAAEYIMGEYLGLDKSLINKIFGRSENEDSPVQTRLRNSRSENEDSHPVQTRLRNSRNLSDFHAPYPSEESRRDYEQLRESIINNQCNKEE